MSDLAWFVLFCLAPVPGWLVWRWRLNRAARRAYRESKEYRRAKFGGAIRKPDSGEVERIER